MIADSRPQRLILTLCTILLLMASAQAQEERTDTEDEWQAPLPEDVEHREGSTVRSFIKGIFSGDWLGGGAYRSELERYQQLEAAAGNLQDKARAILAQAEVLRKAGKYDDAYELYVIALRDYTNWIPLSDVVRIMQQMAEEHFEGDHGRMLLIFPTSSNEKAMDVYETIAEQAPHTEIAAEVTYRAGVLAWEDDEWNRAISNFRKYTYNFPNGPKAADAHLMTAKCMKELIENTESDEKLLRQARREAEQFLQKAPDHPSRSEGEEILVFSNSLEAQHLLFLGKFYMRDAHDRPAAAKRYLVKLVREYPDTPSASEARELLRELGVDTAEAATQEPARNARQKPAADANQGPHLRPLDELDSTGANKD